MDGPTSAEPLSAEQRAETIAEAFIADERISEHPSKGNLAEVARRVIVDLEGEIADAMTRATVIAETYWVDNNLAGKSRARHPNRGDVRKVAALAAGSSI